MKSVHKTNMDPISEKLCEMVSTHLHDTIIYLEEEIGLHVVGIELSHAVDEKSGQCVRKMEMFFANPAVGETKQ